MHRLLVAFVILLDFRNAAFEEEPHERLVKFAEFKRNYSIAYKDAAENAYRFRVFSENLAFIYEESNKGSSYTIGVNKFTDMTHKEFLRERAGRSFFSPLAAIGRMNKYSYSSTRLSQDAPASINWANEGAVNSPIAQGPCNSCYAIGVLGILEAAFWKATGTLPKLSVQQIMDCSKMEGNRGCSWGNLANTLQYIIDNGIVSDRDYPYLQKESSNCDLVVYNKSKQCLQASDVDQHVITIVGKKQLDQLFQALQDGPLLVSVDVTPPQWQSYKGGILESFKCDGEADHSVLLVGYGVENGESYWIIRNSWGTDWGEGGYARLYRDPNAKEGPGFCNIMQYVAVGASFKKPLKSKACRDH